MNLVIKSFCLYILFLINLNYYLFRSEKHCVITLFINNNGYNYCNHSIMFYYVS